MSLAQGRTRSKKRRFAALFAALCMGASLMGASGGCSVRCPQGATHSQLEGGLKACWYEVDEGRWRSIHQGELKVKMRSFTKAAANDTAPQHTYAFVMIQDPKEVWPGKQQGRFGWWRLHIKPEHWAPLQRRKGHDANMLLRWRLRDRPSDLGPAETIHLMASWREAGRRRYRSLRSLYRQRQGVVEAFLPADLHYKIALSLFPIRISKASPMAQASNKRLASVTP